VRTGPTVTTIEVGGERLFVIALDAPAVPSPDRLSPSERDVAARVLAGESNAEIARARGVAVRTIANQIASIFRKLGVGSRAELAARAARPRP
jgi:DNA-binding CsgD family transcriptional regulator